jgi:hypothetical protein
MAQSRQIELALKRGRLQERIASQRAALAAQVVPIAEALNAIDRTLAAGRSGVATIKRHPGLVAAAVAAVVALRPRRVWRWGRRALVGWSMWRKLRGRIEGAGLLHRRKPA